LTELSLPSLGRGWCRVKVAKARRFSTDPKGRVLEQVGRGEARLIVVVIVVVGSVYLSRILWSSFPAVEVTRAQAMGPISYPYIIGEDP
jgi:hypothetical protein